jgi:hypothetical protein
MDARLIVQSRANSESGVTLIETLIALLVLTVGAVGMASTFMHGLQSTSTAPNELIATQKAAEAIESVFSARDSHLLTWAQLRNVSNGGIFVNAATDLRLPGLDGVVNTSDDPLTIESVQTPGPDRTFGNGDDKTQILTGFTRQIAIADLTADMRTITVTITYRAGTSTRTYSLSAIISRYA